jgi:hypothetical protein
MIGELPLEPFRTDLAELVDAIVYGLDPEVRAAIAASLEAGTATLRLAANVAPRFEVTVYLVMHEDPPRPVILAVYPPPAEPAGPPTGPVH